MLLYFLQVGEVIFMFALHSAIEMVLKVKLEQTYLYVSKVSSDIRVCCASYLIRDMKDIYERKKDYFLSKIDHCLS